MCGSLSICSRLSDDRFLARCECGCLHLVWDTTTIRLKASGPSRILRQQVGSAPSVPEGFELRDDPDGGVQVWLGRGGLRLSRDDHRAFLTLIRLGSGVIATSTWDRAHVAPPRDPTAGQLN